MPDDHNTTQKIVEEARYVAQRGELSDRADVLSSGAPKPGTLEWWRWHYAGQALASLTETRETFADAAEDAARYADALIAELTKPPISSDRPES